MADSIADHAKVDSEVAVATAREFAPDFKPSVLERFERIRARDRFRPPTELDPIVKPSALSSAQHPPDSRTLHATIEPTSPLKQQPYANAPASVAAQPIRRTSVLQKQVSVDFPNNSNQYSPQKLNQTTANYSNSIQPQQQQPQSSQYQYGQQQTPGSNYSTPQNYPNMSAQQQNTQLYNSNYNNQDHLDYNNTSSAYGQQQQSSVYGTSQQQNSYGQQNQSNYNNNAKSNYGLDPVQQPQSYGMDPYQQQQQPNDMTGYSNLRRSSRPEGGKPPMLGQYTQSSIDHFDHYKRAPSRDGSVDRYARATSRLGGAGGSRQPSMDRQVGSNMTTSAAPMADATPDRNVRAGSAFRGTTPSNGAVMTGTGSRSGTPSYQLPSVQAVYSSPNQPFEDVLLRQRTLGQDIIPSPREPKRTESLYLPPKPLGGGGAGGGGGGGGGGGAGGGGGGGKKLKVSSKFI